MTQRTSARVSQTSVELLLDTSPISSLGHVTHACRTSCCCSTAAAAAAADAHNRSLVSTVNDIAPVGPRGVERMEISDMGAH